MTQAHEVNNTSVTAGESSGIGAAVQAAAAELHAKTVVYVVVISEESNVVNLLRAQVLVMGTVEFSWVSRLISEIFTDTGPVGID